MGDFENPKQFSRRLIDPKNIKIEENGKFPDQWFKFERK